MLQSSLVPKETGKSRAQFSRVLGNWIDRHAVDRDSSVLAIGGTLGDGLVLRHAGFANVTISNLGGESPEDSSDERQLFRWLVLDAEHIELPDDSYDVVFVHEALHHCRSPHVALCEMLRVAARHVVFLEPNDSAIMRLLVRLKLSFPFEIAAVVNNEFARGGVRNTQIPNYIFRWNAREVTKTVAAYLPERPCPVYAHAYWDFGITEEELALRTQTRIGLITKLIGARNFLRLLRLGQAVCNRIPFVRAQGNKFFCAIEKSQKLRPWLKRSGNDIVFDRKFVGGPD